MARSFAPGLLLLAAVACGSSSSDDGVAATAATGPEPAAAEAPTPPAVPAPPPPVAPTPPADTRPAPPPGWKIVSELGFTVMAPGTPKRETGSMATLAGPAKTTQLTFSLPGDRGMFMIMVAEISMPEGFDVAKALQGGKTNMVKSMNALLDDERDIESGPAKGLDLRMHATIPQLGKIRGRAKVFFHGSRMHQALAITPFDDASAGPLGDRFIDSFELSAAPAAPTGLASLAEATRAAGSTGVKVANVAVDIVEKTIGQGKGGFFMRVSFDVTAAAQLERSQAVTVEAACLVAGETEVSQGTTLGDKLHELAPGASKRADVTPFILTPFASEPPLCNLTFKFRKTFRDQLHVADYCYREGAVAEGRCGDLL